MLDGTSLRYRFNMTVIWQLHLLERKFVNLRVVNARTHRSRISAFLDNKWQGLRVVVFVIAKDFNGHVGKKVEDYH